MVVYIYGSKLHIQLKALHTTKLVVGFSYNLINTYFLTISMLHM